MRDKVFLPATWDFRYQ